MKYCSPECANAARRIPPKVLEERAAKKQTRKICLWCGSSFVTTYPNKIYCTAECTYNGNLRDKRDKWAEDFIPIEFICKECGAKVVTKCGEPLSSFCSIECQKKYVCRAYQIRRKEQIRRAYKAPVSFIRIYKRDHGMCRICGMPVQFDRSPENIWGATIDHLIPLSRGGTHEPSNCQLAHRLCNSLKLDTVDEFKIDWIVKNKEDRGRWTKYLEEYNNQIISKSI